MTREEEIIRAAENNIDISNFTSEDSKLLRECFMVGAEWADMYPVNVWHEASEEPNGPYIVLCDGLDNLQWVENYQHIDMSYANWKNYADAFNINRWAYIKDLLPNKSRNYEQAKGSEE